jgi:hypothetical protein
MSSGTRLKKELQEADDPGKIAHGPEPTSLLPGVPGSFCKPVQF